VKFYSATTNAFYAGELRADFKAAGSWPTDAVEVSDEVHAEFVSPPPVGKRMVPGSDGYPSWGDVPVRSIVDLLIDIDRAAGEARDRFVSPGHLVDQEYKYAESKAREFKAAGYPGDAVPRAVSSWAQAKGWTAQQAADDIIATAGYWYDTIDEIRELRLAGKEATRNASEADRQSTAQAYIDQLNALVPA